ncbi:hypothetical protein COX93_01585 [Candidatus Nomurabacteria bacterium CG_4_10_14_0_2_um_filter_30_12]|uniref:Uncharacterized protein n=1 Tax=Candidatus Nomurabacteria bacterium CG_4_10_14_0_2_um_filter_30_12 TaxID=1974727 RepID=A0A2J0MH08_9BACT|nr:MAG: hypothetical protein COX93_01585 [Candidatus Nomurabacteria bacterium CG_4_10_14_0_2_um_filter_30_12]
MLFNIGIIQGFDLSLIIALLPIILLWYGILLFKRGYINIQLEKQGVIIDEQQNSALRKTSNTVGTFFLVVFLCVFVVVALIVMLIKNFPF